MFLQLVSISQHPCLHTLYPLSLITAKQHTYPLCHHKPDNLAMHMVHHLFLLSLTHWAFLRSSFIIRSAYFVCKPPTRQDLQIDLVHSRCNLWSVCWSLFRNHFSYRNDGSMWNVWSTSVTPMQWLPKCRLLQQGAPEGALEDAQKDLQGNSGEKEIS